MARNIFFLLFLLVSLVTCDSIHVTKFRSTTQMVLKADLINDFPISTTIAASIASFGLAKILVYSKMQVVTATTVAGIPPNSNVVEFDALDGKQIFYLPRGCDYTAVMPLGDDVSKQKQNSNFNERVILESIGKANINGVGLRGKVRSRSQEIPSRSADCVLSIGAVSRSKAPGETLQEVLRLLKPGGLFVFVEPESSLDVIQQVFPAKFVASVQPVQEEDLVEKVLLVKSKRKDKKTKKAQLTEENLQSMSALDNLSDISSFTPAGTFTVSTKETSTKLGLLYERHNNFIECSISGIGVRPY